MDGKFVLAVQYFKIGFPTAYLGDTEIEISIYVTHFVKIVTIDYLLSLPIIIL